MSSSDDETICKICEDFEPQAWRKSLCRNCFHSLDEHAGDLLTSGCDGRMGGSSTFPRTKSKVNDLEKDTKPGKGKGKDCPSSKQKSSGASKPSTESDSPSPKTAVVSKSKSLASKFEDKSSSKTTDSKSPKGKNKSDVSDKSDSAKVANDSKDKKASSKLSDKDSKESSSASRSKGSAPFGKDLLKSVKSPTSDKDKTVPKDEKVKDEKKKAGDVSQRSQHSGGVSDKAGQGATRPGKQDASEGKSGDVKGKFQQAGGAGSGKSSSSSSDSSRTGDKDKTSLYRDRGKDRGGGEQKNEGEARVAADGAKDSPRGKLSSPSTGKQPATSPSQQPTPTSTNTAPTLLSPTSKTNDKRPKDLGVTSGAQTVLGKFKELEKKSPASGSPKDDVAKASVKTKDSADKPVVKDDENEKLKKTLQEYEEKVKSLEKLVARLEKEAKQAAIDAKKVSKEESSSRKSEKDDMDRKLQGLKSKLSEVEGQCDRLATDNQSLNSKLQQQELEQQQQQRESEAGPVGESSTSSGELQLEEDLEMAEKELEEVKDENRELQSQLMEMKNEMDEMYDNFRENEHDEFRELQKELDMTAKNCRILQFKLRKCERRNEQIEEDRVHYEEKLRQLQDQFESKDAKNHIRVLDEELRVAKEVSVRLHDELDIVEDKRGKAMEENRHLTELLEHTDKRQFRLEMEIDKLRDVVSDLKSQLKEAKGSNNNNSSSPDRKVPSSYIYSRSIKD